METRLVRVARITDGLHRTMILVTLDGTETLLVDLDGSRADQDQGRHERHPLNEWPSFRGTPTCNL